MPARLKHIGIDELCGITFKEGHVINGPATTGLERIELVETKKSF